MASDKTILVGGWAKFCEMRGLTKKELPEDFTWMSDSNNFFYSDVRAALDATPGSRDFLCSLYPNDSHRSAIVSEVQDKMTSSHSGSSSSCIIGSYRSALSDWDAWVLASKKDALLSEYKNRQIKFVDLMVFYNRLVHIKPVISDEEGFKKLVADSSITFSDGVTAVNVTWEGGEALRIVSTLLDEMGAMKAEEDTKWRAQRLKDRIEHLKWNLKHPARWFWAGEDHPSYSITSEEMSEMQRVYPAYRSHIALVCSNLHRFGYMAGWEWSSENAAIVDAELVKLGISKAS